VFDEELVLISPRGSRAVRTPADIGGRAVIAFPAGCSYRRRLEEWLGRDRVGPPRVMEFASYHAIVACVSAGAGIAVVPRSVLQLAARTQVHASALPPRIAQARTMLAWRANHRSTVLDALRAHLA